MSWTSPMTFIAGTVLTAAQLNTYVRDNTNELRAGGLAIGSQAANDFLYATSATQLARLAAADGKVPRYTTAGGWAMATLSTQLLKANSGTDTSNGATSVDTFAMASGLTAKDTLLIYVDLASVTQATATPILYNATDAVTLVNLQPSGTTNIAAGETWGGTARIRQAQAGATSVMTQHLISSGASGGVNGQGLLATVTTAWTGAWTLALRHGGVTAGGTFQWTWAVFKIAGQ